MMPLFINKLHAINEALKSAWLLVLAKIFPVDSSVQESINSLKAKACSFQKLNCEISALFDYKNKVVARLILKLKSKGSDEIAAFFASSLLDYLKEKLSEERIWGDKKIYICPIPLHKSKQRKRGFNQNELVLNKIKDELKRMNISYEKNLLVCVKKTLDQKKLNKKERLENMKDAFALNIKLENSSHIIIVDDITTSGSTLTQARRTIKKACRSCSVSLLALARA